MNACANSPPIATAPANSGAAAGWPAGDPRPRLLRTHRQQWPRLRHLPPARRCHGPVGEVHPGTLARHRRPRSAVRRMTDGANCPNLPPGDARLALAAAAAWPDPRGLALAAARRGWQAHRSGVHHRGGARSHRLQHQRAVRPHQRDADHLGVSPPPPRGQPQVRGAPEPSASGPSSARTACPARAIRRRASPWR